VAEALNIVTPTKVVSLECCLRNNTSFAEGHLKLPLKYSHPLYELAKGLLDVNTG